MRNRAALLVFLMIVSLTKCAAQKHITPVSTTPKTYLVPYASSEMERMYHEAQLKTRKKLYTFSDVESMVADIIYQTGERKKITVLVEKPWKAKAAQIIYGISSFFHGLGHQFGKISENNTINELKAVAYQGYAIQLIKQLYPDFYDQYYYNFVQSIEAPAPFPTLLLYYKVYKRFDDAKAVWIFVKNADEEKLRIVLEGPTKEESVFPFFLHNPFYAELKRHGLIDLDSAMLFDIFSNNIRLYEGMVYRIEEKWAKRQDTQVEKPIVYHASNTIYPFNERLRYYAVKTAGVLYDTNPDKAFEILGKIKARRIYERASIRDDAKYIWEKNCEKQFPSGDAEKEENLKQCKLHRMLMSAGVDYFTMYFVDSPELTALTCFEKALEIQDSPEVRALRDFMNYRMANQNNQKKGLKSAFKDQADIDSLMERQMSYRADHWYRRRECDLKNRQKALFWLELVRQNIENRPAYFDLEKLKKEYDEFVPTMKKDRYPVAYYDGEFEYAMRYPREQEEKKSNLERSISFAYIERGDLQNALSWRKKANNTRYHPYDKIWIDLLETKLGIKKPEKV